MHTGIAFILLLIPVYQVYNTVLLLLAAYCCCAACCLLLYAASSLVAVLVLYRYRCTLIINNFSESVVAQSSKSAGHISLLRCW